MAGFTLIEIMVVVIIIGLLAAVVAPQFLSRVDDARISKAKNDIGTIDGLLVMYKLDNYKFPSTDEGLQALVTKPADPNLRNWREGGYMKSLVKDPWKNDYQYVYPGTHGEYDLYTLGADGEQGGEGQNADIGNWNLDQ
ncbi:MAG: type II secretion system major pseudopilin GspG [Steroidobacteraceae bacterium]